MLVYPRILVCSVLIFIFSISAKTQTFQAGLLGGVNLSQLHGDGLAGYNQIGLNIGGRVAITPSERWMWSIDLLFSQKGSNRSSDDNPSVLFDSFRLNYAEVPIMVSFLDWLDDDGDTEFYKLHFTAGIAWSRLVEFKVKDIFGEDITDSQDFRRNGLDLIAGATFFINDKIGINGQYALAVVNVRKDQAEQALQGRTLTFRVIYMF